MNGGLQLLDTGTGFICRRLPRRGCVPIREGGYDPRLVPAMLPENDKGKFSSAQQRRLDNAQMYFCFVARFS